MNSFSYSVDWLSFVGHLDGDRVGHSAQQVFDDVFMSLVYLLPDGYAEEFFQDMELGSKGRAPYKFSYRDASKGITVYASDKQQHYTVEFSGKGIDYLERAQALGFVINAVHQSVSRIDIAVDMETDRHPFAFALDRDEGRSKTYSELTSPSGATAYVGSMSSDRYARVYRYNPPHPRAHLLRAEHVFRKDQAKAIAVAVVSEGISAVVARCWADWGWHEYLDMEEGVSAAAISIPRPERNQGKTTRWLITAAGTAFRRLVAEGVIDDPVSFLKEYFLPPDYPNDARQLEF